MLTVWIVIVGLQVLAVLGLYFWWQQIPEQKPLLLAEADGKECLSLAVVIVVRNERANLPALMEDLSRQTLPVDCFTVWLMDDGSTDGTKEWFELNRSAWPFRIEYQPVRLQNGLYGKKSGITQAAGQTKASLLVVTDGDCRLPANWLAHWASAFRRQDLQFAFGGVVLAPAVGPWEIMQQTEFASLIGAGAALLEVGKPGMCNAANMAFRPETFRRLDGYKGTPDYPGGDDEFLLQKIWKAHPRQARFIKNKELVVRTAAQPTFSAFQQQRIRWAGKWRLHRSWSIRLTALAVFSWQLLFMGCGLWLLASGELGLWFFWPLVAKFGAEFLFLRSVLLLGGQSVKFWSVLLWQILYPVYALWFGIQANRGGFRWKGRNYSLARL